MTEPTQITLLIVPHRYRLNLTNTEIKNLELVGSRKKRRSSWYKHILHRKNIRLSERYNSDAVVVLKFFFSS